MKTSYKILTIVVLGITFVSTGFGTLYLSPGLNPDENLPNVLEQEFEVLYNQKCAEFFDEIYEEFLSRPPVCDTCEPALFENEIRYHEEFNGQNCGFNLENWAYLSKYNDEAWASLDDRFELVGLESEYLQAEPIIVNLEKHGYHMCDDFVTKVIHRESDVEIWRDNYNTFCVVTDPAEYKSFVYKITSKINPLLLSQLGSYYFDVYVQDDLVRGHFSITPLSNEKSSFSFYDINSFEIPVTVNNAIIQDIYFEEDSESIFVNLETFDNGFIVLDLPRKLIDASSVDGGDSSFFVLIEGEEILSEEISSNSETRKISIAFPKGTTQIEIVGADEI